jgi:hypothetical protein
MAVPSYHRQIVFFLAISVLLCKVAAHKERGDAAAAGSSLPGVSPGHMHEAEFDRWYNEEHLPERMEIPGYVISPRESVVATIRVSLIGEFYESSGTK